MSAPTETRPSPAALGYRMPAEWEPHEATWLSWPRPDGISFPDSYERVVPTLAAMVHALGASEKVFINVCDAEHEALVRSHLAKARASSDHVTYFHIPTNEPWCRDHGPIFLTRAEAPRMFVPAPGPCRSQALPALARFDIRCGQIAAKPQAAFSPWKTKTPALRGLPRWAVLGSNQ